jgi:ABC-type amino acid transport substrate-binding protein
VRRIAATLLCLIGAALAPHAVAADALKKIKATKVIRLAYHPEALPFSFERPDGKPAGYSIELCERVVASLREQLGLSALSVRWVRHAGQDRFRMIESGAADLECGTTTVTLARMKRVDFSSLTFVDGGGLAVRRSHPIKAPGDLAGKRIAVVAGSTAQARIAGGLRERLLLADMVAFATAQEALDALRRGDVDAFGHDRLLLAGLISRAPDADSLAVLDELISIEPYALMLRRGDGDLRLAVNRGLAQIYRNGLVREIYQRYFGPLGDPPPLLQAAWALNALQE